MVKIENYYASSPLSLFHEFGMSSDEIKENIINDLSPYFQNKENLENYVTSDLVNNWLMYLSITKNEPESLKFLGQILSIFNQAKKKKKNETIEYYTNWLPEMAQCLSRFWSLHNNQTSLINLCLEDFLEESMNIIGKFIEGLSKDYFKLLLQLNRIKRNKPADIDEIKSKDLGVVIDELISSSNLKDLLIINGLRLNQWRNIAYHHNSKVVNNEMICSYKNKDEVIEFKITKSEMLDAISKLSLIFKLIRTAETIFCFDNINEIQQLIVDKNISTNIRDEAKKVDLYSQITAQGFKVIDLTEKNNISVMKLKDIGLYGDFLKRSIYSSQFLYTLWLYTNSSELIVEYYLPNDDKFSVAEITADSFNNNSEKGSLSELLLEHMVFSTLIKNYQNINPFDSIKEFRKGKQFKSKFRSQRGDKITINEFIEQFTLSVFCNYLVFSSEGVSPEDISINVGGDGSCAIGKREGKSVVLRVPALIKEKSIQKFILSLLGELIYYYNDCKLQVDIVDNAINHNQFYLKKSQVKKQFL